MSADQGTATQRNNSDLEESTTLESTSQEVQGPDTRQEEGEVEQNERVEVAAEGDQELKVLPENKEEQKKEEAVLAVIEKPATKSLLRAPMKRGSRSNHTQRHQQQRIEEHVERKENKKMTLTSLSKQLDKQNTQINNIMRLLQPIQKQIASTERQSELTKRVQSQIKQLQKQVSQVQKRIITKSNKNK